MSGDAIHDLQHAWGGRARGEQRPVTRLGDASELRLPLVAPHLYDGGGVERPHGHVVVEEVLPHHRRAGQRVSQLRHAVSVVRLHVPAPILRHPLLHVGIRCPALFVHLGIEQWQLSVHTAAGGMGGCVLALYPLREGKGWG